MRPNRSANRSTSSSPNAVGRIQLAHDLCTVEPGAGSEQALARGRSRAFRPTALTNSDGGRDRLFDALGLRDVAGAIGVVGAHRVVDDVGREDQPGTAGA